MSDFTGKPVKVAAGECRGARMVKGRQLVYRYDGDANSEETEQDLFEVMPIPKHGDTIERKGKQREVYLIQTTESVRDPSTLPIYRVFLRPLDARTRRRAREKNAT